MEENDKSGAQLLPALHNVWSLAGWVQNLRFKRVGSQIFLVFKSEIVGG